MGGSPTRSERAGGGERKAGADKDRTGRAGERRGREGRGEEGREGQGREEEAASG